LLPRRPPRHEQEWTIQSDTTTARSLALAGYPIALLLIIVPLLDAVPKMLPANFGSPDWRYGAVGFLFGSIATPLIGLTIAAVAALVARQRIMLMVVSLVFLLLALVLVVGGVAFLVDFGGISAKLSERVTPAFHAATVKTTVIALLAALASVWLGLGGLRVARAGAVVSDDKAAGLVVGH
jgi:hypothetical protein